MDKITGFKSLYHLSLFDTGKRAKQLVLGPTTHTLIHQQYIPLHLSNTKHIQANIYSLPFMRRGEG